MDGQFRSIAALDPASGAIEHAEQRTGDRNYLLVGSDTRLGASPSDG
ncbi:hypothetical protein GCM10027174_41110 [Salinifilum aidingensis]